MRRPIMTQPYEDALTKKKLSRLTWNIIFLKDESIHILIEKNTLRTASFLF